MKRYVFLPGIVLLIAAFARAAVNVHWDRVNIGMGAVGAAILAVSLAWNWSEVKAWWHDPRGVFAVATGIWVAILVGILVLVNIAVSYRPARVDLTASGRNTVTAETRALVKKLTRDVALRQFGRTRDPRVDQLLASFQNSSPRIRVEFVDAERQPRETRRYGVIKNGTVVVTAGEKFRKVDNPTEQALATALLQVTTDVERKICFVTGHGEHGLADESPTGLSGLAKWLEASNFSVDRVSLLESTVPASCSVLVLAGPKHELEPEEVSHLTAFADAAGRVAILIDPAPGISLADWLKPRGVIPGKGIIVDTSGAGQVVGGGPQTPLALAYADHPITHGFEIATIYDVARPLDVIDKPELGGKPVALAKTSNRSFEAPNSDAQTATFAPERDRRGPFVLAAATTIKRSGRPGDEIRLVVFGDSDFVSNGFFGRQGNATLFLRTISWLVGEAEATIVSAQDRENRRIDLTERTRDWMYAVNLVFLPLIPLVSGIIVLVRSRR